MSPVLLDNSKFVPGYYFRIKNRTKEDINLTYAPNQPAFILKPENSFSIDGQDILKNDWLKNQIETCEGQGLLDIRNLRLAVETNYFIHNQTARRIGIKHYSQNEDLILPPFGSRELSSDFLRSYDFLPWERQSLIKKEAARQQKKNNFAIGGISILAALFVVFLIVSLPLSIFIKPTLIEGSTILLVSTIFVIALAVSIYVASKLTNLGDMGESVSNWLELTPGIGLILLTGIGLPFLAVFLFGEGQKLFFRTDTNLASLGRIMQISFIAAAAMFPAMLFYLFGRLQVGKQRENFFREAMQLDPNVQSFSEAANKYDPLLDSVFGSGNSPFSILLLVITTAMMVMGWLLVLNPVGATDNLTSLITFFTPRPTPFALGFLGTYFFAINLVFRRYVRSDLTPKTYAYIILRMLVTLVLVWAVSTLPQFSGSAASPQPALTGIPLVDSGLMAVAFIIGVFPDTGLALISDFVKGITKNIYQGEKEESFPLSDLEGMNLYDRARLLEEGIENIENLAHHDMMELIPRTRIPTARVVDMYDQSLLYIHLGINSGMAEGQAPPNPDQGYGLRSTLKSYGIRTATDLVFAFEHTDTNLGHLDQVLGPAVISRLKVITDAVKDEDLLDNISNWYYLSVTDDPVTDPYRFYKVSLNKHAPIHPELEAKETPAKASPPVSLAVNGNNPPLAQPATNDAGAVGQAASPAPTSVEGNAGAPVAVGTTGTPAAMGTSG